MAKAWRPSLPLHSVETAPQSVSRPSAAGSERCQPAGSLFARGTSLASSDNTHNGSNRKSVLFTGNPAIVHQGVGVDGSTVHVANASQKTHSAASHRGHKLS